MTSSTYASLISALLVEVSNRISPLLLFGENINQGSCISGLARGLDDSPTIKVVNVGNCELTHVGVGLGILLDGGSSVLIVKQLDFLLLSLDQIVNTYYWIRAYTPLSSQGSFTIYCLICDQGLQGPQSSLNNASDIASLANIDVYCLNTATEIDDVVRHRFVSPGFRIVCLSQRYLGSEPINPKLLTRSSDYAVYQYLEGTHLTILCYNFSLRIGFRISEELLALGFTCDVFHVNYLPRANLQLIINSCSRSNRLLILDDSKSVGGLCNYHLSHLVSEHPNLKSLVLSRKPLSSKDYSVHDDSFDVDVNDVLKFIHS